MRSNTRLKIFYLTSLLLLILAPGMVDAQNYCTIGAGISVPCAISGQEGPAGQATFGDVIISIVDIALAIVGSLAVIFLIWGGFRYVTAYGNEENSESAKRIIQHSILGLVIVLLAFVIVRIISLALITGQVF